MKLYASYMLYAGRSGMGVWWVYRKQPSLLTIAYLETLEDVEDYAKKNGYELEVYTGKREYELKIAEDE